MKAGLTEGIIEGGLLRGVSYRVRAVAVKMRRRQSMKRKDRVEGNCDDDVLFRRFSQEKVGHVVGRPVVGGVLN